MKPHSYLPFNISSYSPDIQQYYLEYPYKIFGFVQHLPKNIPTLNRIIQSEAAYNLSQILSEWIHGFPLILEKDHRGKPFWNHSSYHLSITHSQHSIAIFALEHKRIGIDIEALDRKKIHSVLPRVCSPHEIQTDLSIPMAVSIWSAKEAVYKSIGEKGVPLATHIKLWQTPEGLPIGALHLHTSPIWHRIYHLEVNNSLLTIAIEA